MAQRLNQEFERLAALARLDVLDSEIEPQFENFTRTAAQVFNAPIALISLVAEDRQWFKSCIGLGISATSRDVAFCDHTIRGDDPLIVLDATSDERFCHNALVTGEPHIRVYAGAPVTTLEGSRVGTLCIIDTKSRLDFTTADRAILQSLASSVMFALNARVEARASKVLSKIAADRQQLILLGQAMSHVGTWSWDVASNTTTWSDETYRIHGLDPSLSPPDLEGVLSLYAPADAGRLRQLVLQAVEEGRGYDLDATIVRQDGTTRQVIAKCAVSQSESGSVEALMGTFQDVTDMRLADRALRLSEFRYRMLAENVADLIVKHNLDGVIEYVSPSVKQFLGFEPQQLLGRTMTDFGLDIDWLGAEGSPGQAQPVLIEGETQVRRADGQQVWALGNPSIICNAEDEPIGTVTVFRDVTARRALKEELRAKRAEAELATQAKSQFLANMSHEIRTPLTSVIGFASLLDHVEGLPERARGYVSRIAAGGRALLSLVDDILDFSRIDAGRVQFEPAPTELTTFFDDTVALLSPEADKKHLDLTVDLSKALPPWVCVDQNRLRQILLNLLGNAIKHTQHGSVCVSVSYWTAGGGYLRVAVTDTGIGIAAETADLLFQRFSQIDNSNVRRHHGAGLGLAICRGLVEAMGGEIGVESEQGRGSTFWFTVAAPIADPVIADHATDAAEPDLPPLRILIVDDLDTNRELIATILGPFDIELVEAVDGVEAIAAAERARFDLILMDLQMPRMDGLAATRAIRAHSKRNRTTPILAFTANVLPEHVSACREAGLNDHIGKPIVVVDLLSKIEQWTSPSINSMHLKV